MKRDAQVKIIKRHLLKGLTINFLQAIVKYKIHRLSARIKDLDYAGFIIDSFWSGSGQSQFKEYYIKEENL